MDDNRVKWIVAYALVPLTLVMKWCGIFTTLAFAFLLVMAPEKIAAVHVIFACIGVISWRCANKELKWVEENKLLDK